MSNFLQLAGLSSLSFLVGVGRAAIFAATALSHCVRPPFYGRLLLRQLVEIGYYSLPVVGLTALFTGMMLALQMNTASRSMLGVSSPSPSCWR